MHICGTPVNVLNNIKLSLELQLLPVSEGQLYSLQGSRDARFRWFSDTGVVRLIDWAQEVLISWTLPSNLTSLIKEASNCERP